MHIPDFGLRSDSICSIPFLFPLELKFYSQKTQFDEWKLKKKRFIMKYLEIHKRCYPLFWFVKLRVLLKPNITVNTNANQLEATTSIRRQEWERKTDRIRQRRFKLGRRKNKNFLKLWFKVSVLAKKMMLWSMNLFIVIKKNR